MEPAENPGAQTPSGGTWGTLGPPDPPRWAEISNGTIRQKTASVDGLSVSVCLGLSEFGAELRICVRWFDSSRGHAGCGSLR